LYNADILTSLLSHPSQPNKRSIAGVQGKKNWSKWPAVLSCPGRGVRMRDRTSFINGTKISFVAEERCTLLTLTTLWRHGNGVSDTSPLGGRFSSVYDRYSRSLSIYLSNGTVVRTCRAYCRAGGEILSSNIDWSERYMPHDAREWALYDQPRRYAASWYHAA